MGRLYRQCCGRGRRTVASNSDIAAWNPEPSASNKFPTYFYATDPKALADNLDNVGNAISLSLGSASTVAANSTHLDTVTTVYQARFDSKVWSGRILAFDVADNGRVDTTASTAKWDTDTKLTRAFASGGNRKIYTYDAVSSSSSSSAAARSLVRLTSIDSSPSIKTVLTGTDTAALALKRFNWLIGGNADESAAGGLRERTVLLGDIVNSDPAYAGATNQHYNLLPSSYGSTSYAAYVENKKDKTKRKAALAVGANDGMVHVFDATEGSADAGTELFAYIPRGVYAKLAGLSSRTYSHQYTVDGPIYVSDFYNGTAWRTAISGSLGFGGRGAFAIDITDVLNVTSPGDPIVLFDYSAEDSATPFKDDLGYNSGKVIIVPTMDGKWTAIFGNGNNSNNGVSKLITVDISTLSNKVINTGAAIGTTKENGLSGPALLPNVNGIITTAYAGDIAGNMWKFDLSNTDKTNWDNGYTGGGIKPVIKVLDPAGVAQPIWTTPTLGINSLKKVGTNDSIMIYFGTGKFYETTDKTSTQTQSIYAIADTGALTLTQANRTTGTTPLLQAKVITETTTKRTVTPDATPASGAPLAVDWTSTAAKSGWVADLIDSRERVLSKPLLIYDRLILSTFIPSSNQCDYGGAGWLMELTGVGDRFLGKSILGTNGNAKLDVPIMGGLTPIIAGENIYILGSQLGKPNEEPKVVTYDGKTEGERGRLSWRQIK